MDKQITLKWVTTLDQQGKSETVDIAFLNDNVYAEDMIVAIGALVSKLSEQTGTDKTLVLKEVKSLLINNKSTIKGKNV